MDRNTPIHKLQFMNTLSDYCSLQHRPVNTENYNRYVGAQNRKIEALMHAAYDIPFYRDRFEKSGTRPDDYHCAQDLYKFPLLSLTDLRELMEHEADHNPGRYGGWSAMKMRGEEGQPIRCLISPSEQSWLSANWLRILTLTGYNPMTGKTMCLPDAVPDRAEGADYTVQKFGLLKRRIMSDTSKLRMDTQTSIDEINAYQPDYLYHRAEFLLEIADYVKRQGVYMWRPQFFTPLGDFSDDARQTLTEVFGNGLLEAHNTADVGYSIVRIPGKKYYQVMSDLYAINIYSASLDGPAATGTAVVTPLYKTDLPLINLISQDRMRTYHKRGLLFVKSTTSDQKEN